MIDFDKMDGLAPGIVQDARTGEVLMLGFLNSASYQKTVETGFVTFWSRTRQKLWMKGETSGQRLVLREMRVDCDRDALLVRATLDGGAVCHEGYRSCFFRSLNHKGVPRIVAERSFDPQAVYGPPTAVASSAAARRTAALSSHVRAMTPACRR